MPELPEIEHLRRTLCPLLIGRQVLRAMLHRTDILDQLGARVSPRFALLEGGVITALHRRGKNLSIEVRDGRVLGVHLGMTGQCFVAPTNSDPFYPTSHRHAEWDLSQPSQRRATQRLVFRDPRRFGGLIASPNQSTLEAMRWSKLGPDALSVGSGELHARLIGVRRRLKAALLDQSLLAGMGNIYVDESLFAAKLDPRSLASALTKADCKRLQTAIRKILTTAVSAGGSTLRDYRDGNGQRGSFATHHLVYGRGGLPCVVCGSNLIREAIAQRTTVWCAQCQVPIGFENTKRGAMHVLSTMRSQRPSR